MLAKYYKLIIGLLLANNITCGTIIYILSDEIKILQGQLSEMTSLTFKLNDKLTRIEEVQEKALPREVKIEKGNVYILGGAVIIIGIVILMYFGGIDPGALGQALNLSADQSTLEIIGQNKLIGENLKACLSSIDYMNKHIAAEVTSKAEFICNKIDIMLNSMITKNLDFNSGIDNLSTRRSDWDD